MDLLIFIEIHQRSHFPAEDGDTGFTISYFWHYCPNSSFCHKHDTFCFYTMIFAAGKINLIPGLQIFWIPVHSKEKAIPAYRFTHIVL